MAVATEPGIAGGHSVTPVRFSSLIEAFDHWVTQKPDADALSYFGRHATWAQLDARVDAIAAALQDRGLGAGDRIMIQLQNQPEFITIELAAWRLGAVIVPVSPMYSVREVRKLVDDCEPVVFVTDRGTWNRQGPACIDGTSVRAVVTTGIGDFGGDVPPVFDASADDALTAVAPDGVELVAVAAVADAAATVDRVAVTSDDLAIIEYTSGTTGAPKGARVLHRGVVWTATGYVHYNQLEEDDNVILAIAPLTHITGQAFHLGTWLVSGARLVLGYRMQPDYYAELLESEGVTWTTGTSTAYIALLGALDRQPRSLSTLRALGCGGAPVPAELMPKITATFGHELRPGYGLTETSSGCVTTVLGVDNPRDPESGIISVGKAQGETLLKVIDEDGSTLPFGSRGEICIKGPSVVDGYWRNPEETAATFVDGWLRTGDVGFIDENEFVYIADRTKNMIAASGFKVWPREVEEVLYQLPAVHEVAVVGVPDAYRGENVAAVISVRSGHTLDAETVTAHARANLAAYKVPKRIEFVDEVPKNFNGKIVHKDVRAALLAADEPAAANG